MDDRSLIHTEIDRLTDEQLAEVAARIREIKNEPIVDEEPGFLARMLKIQIDAPEDFSMQVLRARHGDAGDE